MKIALLLLLFVPMASFSQKCIEKKDDFTGDITKLSSVVLQGNMLLDPTFLTNIGFEKTNNKTSLSFIYSAPGENSSTKAEQLTLLVKFVDGEVLKLNPNERSIVQVSKIGLRNITMIAFSADLPEDLLNKFCSKQVSKIRLGLFNDQGIDYDLKQKKAADVNKAANCLNSSSD